jgi:hypoxanthine phosphoribosyltransferase
MQPSDQPLISGAQIAQRVGELAREIAAHHKGQEVLLVGVLKGAVPFVGDLMRAMDGGTRVDYIRAQSYDGTESQGAVRLAMGADFSVAGEHVVVVEDILDTGRTTSSIMERIRAENPASLTLCVLLDKPDGRIKPIEADFVGFTIEDHFVVGYGLDYDQQYRGLSGVHVLEE